MSNSTDNDPIKPVFNMPADIDNIPTVPGTPPTGPNPLFAEGNRDQGEIFAKEWGKKPLVASLFKMLNNRSTAARRVASGSQYWEGAADAFEQVKKYLNDVGEVQPTTSAADASSYLLRWVKASERLPSNSHELPIKIIDGTTMFSIGRLRPRPYDTDFEDIVNMNYYPPDQIEWLEETVAQKAHVPCSPVEDIDCYCAKNGCEDKHSCGWYNYDNVCTRKKGDLNRIPIRGK